MTEVVKKKRVPSNQLWTPEAIKEVALGYTTKREFREGNLSAYKAAVYQKITAQVTRHMPGN